MKSVCRILVLLLVSSASYAQASFLQRLAFGPVDLAIAANELSAPIQSFCFDHFRSGPGELSGYKFMQYDGESKIRIGNNAPISMQEAFDKGYLEIEGDGFGSFQFKNNTGEEMAVTTLDNSLLGDVANDKRSATKEDLKFINSRNQPKIWKYRDQFAAEEKRIMVYQKEGLLTNNNPTKAELKKANEAFKDKYKIKTEVELSEKVDDLYYKAAEDHMLEAEKIKVFLDKNLISNNHPTSNELKSAEKRLMEIYGLRTEEELLYKIEDLSWEIDDRNELKTEKLLVYQDQKLLPAGKTSDAELKVAETEFKVKYGIHTENELIDKVSDLYSQIKENKRLKPLKTDVYRYEGLLEDLSPDDIAFSKAEKTYAELHKLNGTEQLNEAIEDEIELIDIKKYVLEKEGEPVAEDPALLKEGEKRFIAKHAVGIEKLTDVFEEYYHLYYHEEANALNLLDRITPSDAEAENTIKELQKELGLAMSGNLNDPALLQTLDFYSRNFNFIINAAEQKGAAGFIEDIKKFKQISGLPGVFTVDEASKEFVNGLDKSLKKAGTNLQSCRSGKIEGNKLYLCAHGTDDFSNKIIEMNLADKSVKVIDQYESYFADACYINKLSNTVFVVNDKITGIEELYNNIESSPLYKETNAIHFGKDMSLEDIQSIVITSKIRNIIAEGEDILTNFKITSAVYDFSVLPRFELSNEFLGYADLDFSVNKLKEVPKGSGVTGNIRFSIRDIASSTISKVKAAISNLYTRMRGNKGLNFASELKNDLAKYHIEISSIKATMGKIEVTLELRKENPQENETYCLND